jgi:hypothetical protein
MASIKTERWGIELCFGCSVACNGRRSYCRVTKVGVISESRISSFHIHSVRLVIKIIYIFIYLHIYLRSYLYKDKIIATGRGLIVSYHDHSITLITPTRQSSGPQFVDNGLSGCSILSCRRGNSDFGNRNPRAITVPRPRKSSLSNQITTTNMATLGKGNHIYFLCLTFVAPEEVIAETKSICILINSNFPTYSQFNRP